MLKICLSRVGKKKQPTYRVIVLEKTKDPWGDYLELLGTYDPKSKAKKIELKAERIQYWLSKGAQPSPTVHNLLVDKQIIKKDKVKASSGKPRKKKKGGDDKTAGGAAQKPAEGAAPAQLKTEDIKPVKSTEEKPTDTKPEEPKKEEPKPEATADESKKEVREEPAKKEESK